MRQLQSQWSHGLAQPTPVSGWPFSPSAAFAQALRRLMVATRGLPLTGWETSCRLSPAGITLNRLLLGLDLSPVAPDRLQGLPQELGMPAVVRQDFLRELPHARRLLLAAEEGLQGVELKVYHEFERSMPDDAELPATLDMRGRKWREEGAQMSHRCTDYFRSGLDADAMQVWLTERSALPPAVLAVMSAAVQLARQSGSSVPDCLAVTEPSSERLSCCLRFYDTGLRLQALRPALNRLAQVWNLQSSFLTRLPAQRRLSWLAAGMDATGFPFLTLYGESSLADARLAIALGASS